MSETFISWTSLRCPNTPVPGFRSKRPQRWCAIKFSMPSFPRSVPPNSWKVGYVDLCHGRTEGKQLDQYETNVKPRRWDWVSKTKREEHGSHKNGQDMIGWLGWKFKINPKRSSTALNERATKVITVHSYHIWSFRWCGLQVTSVAHIKQTEVSCIITFQQQNNALIKRRHQSWRYGALTCIWLNVCFRSKSYFLHPTKKNETQDLKHDAFYI